MATIVCPTCGRLLADKVIPYENGMREIENNQKLSKEERMNEKIKLIDSLKIPRDRYCCRMRLITYIDLVYVVK